MKNTVLARRYAKALFQVGKEEKALDKFSKILNEISKVFTDTPEVVDGLTNPMYPQEVREKVMAHLVKSAKAPEMMGNFLNLLVQKRRAGVLPDIAEVFQSMVDQERNVCQGTVISASKVSGSLNKKIKATLEKITGPQDREIGASTIGSGCLHFGPTCPALSAFIKKNIIYQQL